MGPDNIQHSEKLKDTDPESYFQKILCEEDFAELERLNKESNRKIDWKTLSKDWVCEIKWDELIWITWPLDLHLRWTSITSLWKLKKVKWWLDLYNVLTLEDLGEFE